MLRVQLGDKLSRIMPPSDGAAGYCQSGTVVSVTNDQIVVLPVRADGRPSISVNARHVVCALELGSV